MPEAVGTEHFTMVGGEEDDRVVIQILFLELVENGSDAMIQQVHETRVNAPRFPPFLALITGTDSARHVIEVEGD